MICKVRDDEVFYGQACSTKISRSSQFFGVRVCSRYMWVYQQPPISMQASIGTVQGMCTVMNCKTQMTMNKDFGVQIAIWDELICGAIGVDLGFLNFECKHKLELDKPEQTKFLGCMATWCLEFVEPWLGVLHHFVIEINLWLYFQ